MSDGFALRKEYDTLSVPAELLADVRAFHAAIAVGLCPHCEQPMVEIQAGRHTYAQPCGHMLRWRGFLGN